MQTMYNVKDPINILVDQIETGKDFSIAGNSPFSVLELTIRITKLKDLKTHSLVQIPVPTFHVEYSVLKFLPRRLASGRTCKYP